MRRAVDPGKPPSADRHGQPSVGPTCGHPDADDRVAALVLPFDRDPMGRCSLTDANRRWEPVRSELGDVEQTATDDGAEWRLMGTEPDGKASRRLLGVDHRVDKEPPSQDTTHPAPTRVSTHDYYAII